MTKHLTKPKSWFHLQICYSVVTTCTTRLSFSRATQSSMELEQFYSTASRLPEVPKFLKEKLKPNRRSCHNCSAGFQMSHLSDAKLHWELSTNPGMKMLATDFATPVLATSRLRSWSLPLSPPFFIHNEIGFKLFAEFLSAYFLWRLPPHCSTRNMLEFKNESSMWLLSR